MLNTVTHDATPPVTLTESAAERVIDQMARRDDVHGLRFGVQKYGCSGLGYVVDLADTINDDDHVFESRGVKIIIDNDSLLRVAGTEIDYGTDGLSQTFLFSNPNATGSCGCGESFTAD